MKTVIYSTRFRKDFKRYHNQPRKLEKLFQVVRMLEEGKTLPSSSRPHLLTGEYAGCMECHVEGDFLLVWVDEQEQVVKLLRLGSHAELFG